MKKPGVIVWMLGFVLMSGLSCGKKGPPTLPAGKLDVLVKSLKAEWRDNGFTLKGVLVHRKGKAIDKPEIVGAEVYHACYALENPPCETCPIDYRRAQKIPDVMDAQGRFACRLPADGKQGIHFLKVRLVGRSGAFGPFSEPTKVMIKNYD